MAKLSVLFVLFAGFLLYPLDSKISNNKVKLNRSKRQAPVGILNPPIPTSIAHFLGKNKPIDQCQRDEVLFSDGQCYQLLTQGPCTINQYILLDPDNNKPYCAERLCGPDRIFVFSDQLCHDPRNSQLCPPGRQLYETMYGTPICQCPAGTYEGDDDLDDDVCDPLLGQTLSCPPGQIFWFRDFSLPPECLPDPCGGENLNRGPNDQPFVPFSDGRCFQLGTMPNVCPAQTWFSIALERLQGVCSSLEDAGYQVYDPDTLAQLIEIYGPPIARDSTAPIPASPSGPAAGPTTGTLRPSTGTGGVLTPGSPVGGGNQLNIGITQVSGGPSVTAAQRPGLAHQGALSGRPGTTGFGTVPSAGSGGSIGGRPNLGSQGISVSGGQGMFNQGISSGNQGVSAPSGGSITGGQAVLSQGISSGNQGSAFGGTRPVHQGAFNQGISPGNQGLSGIQGGFGQGISPSSSGLSPGSQGGFGQGITSTSQSNFGQPLSSGGPSNFGQGTGVQGSFGQAGGRNPITFPGSSSSPGFSSRPTSPFGGISPALTVTQGYPTSILLTDHSMEMFGLYDDDLPDFRTDDHSQLSSDLEINEGMLIANIGVPSYSSSGDVALLQAPHGHELHGFFNSVRTLVASGPHNRSRRSPLPHAAPGNVFETRLVGCRAGAERDLNAKCKDTVLPPRTPASRPARAAPPVPPRPGCPDGQAFNIRRMCEPSGSAVNSVNRFNLG